MASAGGASRLLAAVALAALAVAGCGGSAGTPRPQEFPLVACDSGGANTPTPPLDFTIIAPGTIAFGWETWHNMTADNGTCGAQAVRGARSTIPFSILDGEDRIPWAATLAWTRPPTAPDPVLPMMTLFRLDAAGPVVVATETGSRSERYRMMGNYGHDAVPGSYLMRITSGSGSLLAEGRFEIVE